MSSESRFGGGVGDCARARLLLIALRPPSVHYRTRPSKRRCYCATLDGRRRNSSRYVWAYPFARSETRTESLPPSSSPLSLCISILVSPNPSCTSRPSLPLDRPPARRIIYQTYLTSPESTLASAGIHENGAQPRLKRVRGFICEVCYDDESSKGECLGLSCDHRCEFLWSRFRRFSPIFPASARFERAGRRRVFSRCALRADELLRSYSSPPVCKPCYAQYVTSKIVDEGESRRIQCMGSKCNVIVDENTVGLLVEPDVLEK